MRNSNKILVLGLALALATPLKLGATVVQMNSVADVRIVSLAPDRPDGKGYHLSVYSGKDYEGKDDVYRTLISFDLSAIPSGHTLNSATLTLHVQYVGANLTPGLPMEVYRVTRPWTETGVTWNSSGLEPWTVAGGDYTGTGAGGTMSYAANSTAIPVAQQALHWDITTLAREWYSGAQQNYGLLLLSDRGNLVDFYSSEMGGRVGWGPALTVDYAPIPEPSTCIAGALLLLPLGVTGMRYLRNRKKIS